MWVKVISSNDFTGAFSSRETKGCQDRGVSRENWVVPEKLCVINDTEKNAYCRLVFLVYSQLWVKYTADNKNFIRFLSHRF